MTFQPPGFVSVTDIANRALQHVGSENLDSSVNDTSKRASFVKNSYVKLRQAELRSNMWRFAIRRSVIRPIAATSYIWTPPTWAIGTTYAVGAVVAHNDGIGVRYYISNVASNLGNDPDATQQWEDYFGPVYAVPYSATISYFSGDLIYVSTTPYISLVSNNLNNTPASSPTKWVAQTGTLVLAEILYPVGAGPVDQTTTKNIYPLPYGWLLDAPQEPKAGEASTLIYSDWRYEGNFIVTRESQAIVLRFIADISSVPTMDALFCELLAARIATELCEVLTQSHDKIQIISAVYGKAVGEARRINRFEVNTLPMGGGFNLPEDIANRALQHVGIDRISSFAENTSAAKETQFAYDKLRTAELRRNVWRFATRRNTLYAIDSTTKKFTAPTWAVGTTYANGVLVSFNDGYSDVLWQSQQASNTGNVPGHAPTYWQQYFGPVTANVYATYVANAGDITYVAGSPNAWYLSLVSNNSDTPPTSNWATLSITGFSDLPFQILYPIGSSVFHQNTTRNIFVLPYGHLRRAPQDPKAGSATYLGSPTALVYTDWLFEGNFIITREYGPLFYRYVADIKDVTTMDALFCEGLAARIGMEVCETLTPPPPPDAKFPQQSATNKIVAISAEYKRFMGEARVVNSIEEEAEEPPRDDYLAVRY